MHIRTHSWGKANLSWSTVQEQLLRAAVNLGHKTLFVSTNGYEGMEDWTEEKSNQIIAEDTANSVVYDIDVTYTIPVNFKQRFLKDSRVKIGK